jgi:hypothetical protein
MTSASELREREAFRARMRQYIVAGARPSRIAKETGKGYGHVKRVYDQEVAAMAGGPKLICVACGELEVGVLSPLCEACQEAATEQTA